MIGVGAPWILGAAVFAALVTGVLHFISVRHPPVLLLPTMRFLPEHPVRAVSRSTRPSDLLLLLLRVMAVLLMGAALSGLYWRTAGVKHGRVVVIQRGRDGNIEMVRNAAARAMRGAFAMDTATRVVVMDPVAHALNAAESQAFKPETLSNAFKPETLSRAFTPEIVKQTFKPETSLQVRWPTVASAPTMSAAVLAATRAASLLVREERNVDAVDLVIVAPLVRDWKDAAVPSVRAAWPGVIRFHDSQEVAGGAGGRMAQRKGSVTLVGATASDAVQWALTVRGWIAPSGATTGAAANAAANFTGGVGVASPISLEWPASGVPEGWTPSTPRTVGAVVARGEALVFPFTRTSHIPAAILAQGRALAWWSDGDVAAVEIPTATSCTRHVGIPVPPSSDVLQGQAARALLLALAAPCGGERDNKALTVDEVRALAGTGRAAPASAFKSAGVVRTPWAALLLMLAIALLIAEWLVRDRQARLNAMIDPPAGNMHTAA